MHTATDPPEPPTACGLAEIEAAVRVWNDAALSVPAAACAHCPEDGCAIARRGYPGVDVACAAEGLATTEQARCRATVERLTCIATAHGKEAECFESNGCTTTPCTGIGLELCAGSPSLAELTPCFLDRDPATRRPP